MSEADPEASLKYRGVGRLAIRLHSDPSRGNQHACQCVDAVLDRPSRAAPSPSKEPLPSFLAQSIAPGKPSPAGQGGSGQVEDEVARSLDEHRHGDRCEPAGGLECLELVELEELRWIERRRDPGESPAA